jgi:hypothetical protein
MNIMNTFKKSLPFLAMTIGLFLLTWGKPTQASIVLLIGLISAVLLALIQVNNGSEKFKEIPNANWSGSHFNSPLAENAAKAHTSLKLDLQKYLETVASDLEPSLPVKIEMTKTIFKDRFAKINLALIQNEVGRLKDATGDKDIHFLNWLNFNASYLLR